MYDGQGKGAGTMSDGEGVRRAPFFHALKTLPALNSITTLALARCKCCRNCKPARARISIRKI